MVVALGQRVDECLDLAVAEQELQYSSSPRHTASRWYHRRALLRILGGMLAVECADCGIRQHTNGLPFGRVESDREQRDGEFSDHLSDVTARPLAREDFP